MNRSFTLLANYTQVPPSRPQVSSWRFALMLMQSVVYVLRARLRLFRFMPADVERLNSRAKCAVSQRSDRNDAVKDPEGNVAWLIPRVAGRLPLRGDCLVQAMAAQEFLVHLGIASVIGIAIRQESGAKFESHAWLAVDKRVVVGGDLKGFSRVMG